MAVMVAPWLRGTDVIGSASAGANVGLSARARDLQAAAQRQAAMEFAQRLNQQSYQFDRNIIAEQDTAAARLAMALREQDALGAYRQEQMKLEREQLRSREGIEGKRLAADALRQDAMDSWRKTQLESTNANRKLIDEDRDRRLDYLERGGAGVPPDVQQALTMGNADLAIMRKDISDQKKAISAEEDADKKIELKAGMLDTIMEAERTKDNLLRMTTNRPAASVLQAAPAVPTQSASERVIVVKDGKRFTLPKSQLDEALSEGYKLWQ